MNWSHCPDVELNPKVMSGLPVVKGTRVQPELILEHVEDGFTPEEIVTEIFPTVSLSRALRVLDYARRQVPSAGQVLVPAMSRVLLDENMPLGLARMLRDHDVQHVLRLAGRASKRGSISKAEQEGFQVIVTRHQNLRYQQNLRDRELAIVVLSTNRWIDIRGSSKTVVEAVGRAGAGGFQEVKITRHQVAPPSRGYGSER